MEVLVVPCHWRCCGSDDDAHHGNNPNPSGASLAVVVRLALAECSLSADQFGYLNAHGTATLFNDSTDSLALRMALGPSLASTCSSNSKIGPAMDAAEALEAMQTMGVLRSDALPPTFNPEVPDPASPLRHPAQRAVETTLSVAFSVTLGFIGHSGSVVSQA